jgi:acetylornithine/succinyldiaminopimelate/putrescine aminotransferase
MRPHEPLPITRADLAHAGLAAQQTLAPLRTAGMTGGIVVEPIQSDAGVIVPPDDFPPGARALCDTYDLRLIVDEVKVSIGRTGIMWGCERTQTVPDILVTGNALASGLRPTRAHST